ncbi:MAG: hypothetical protein H6670_15175 [Anaerolineaceae bacterium]|nr:hypothetical protein [Anaerolineaceae bacterium]
MYREKRVLILLALLTLAVVTSGCGIIDWLAPTEEPIIADQPGMIIFDAEEDSDMLRAYYWLFPEGTEFWTPSRDDILALGENATRFLQTDDVTQFHPDLWARYDDYWRQYVGFVRDGQRLIYANYFCRAEAGWLDRLLEVADGGDCYFQLTYDVDSQRFVNWYVNGEA